MVYCICANSLFLTGVGMNRIREWWTTAVFSVSALTSTSSTQVVYMPKHCLWLDQVEIWFEPLTLRLLKWSHFSSTKKLKQRVLAFVDYDFFKK